MPDPQPRPADRTGRTPAASDPPAWHALEADAALARLGSGPAGLAEGEAAARLAAGGPNRLTPAKSATALQRFLRQFANTLILILVAAAIVMLAIGETVDAIVVAAVVVINAIIGHVQEGRAEQAMAAIRAMLSPQATVLRDGGRRTVPAEDLVPGDVVLLASGDKVPADLRLLEVRGLEVQEAALTGESVSVAKHTAPVAADAPLGDRRNAAFSGTLVTRGTAKGVVHATGDATEIGRIGALLARTEETTTPLMAQIGAFGRWLTLAILALGAATFAVGVLFRGYTTVEMFQAAVGLAVAAIPEGLPAILTITMAIGVTRMAQRKAIIRRLPAVETLGAVSVICTDKTGTLTRNEMTVRVARTPRHRFAVAGVGYDPVGAMTGGPLDEPLLTDLARAALLCNDAALHPGAGGWAVEGDPVDGALLAFAAKAGLAGEGRSVDGAHAVYARLDCIPFESDRAYMATLNRIPGGEAMAFVKGAPEALLRRCAHVNGQPGPIDRGGWMAAVEELAAEGHRVLAVACKPMPGEEVLRPIDLDGDLVFLGLLGLIDPARAEAAAAIAECREAGIAVKMITGDHAVTARAVAAGVGLSGGTVSGPELDRMDEAAFARAAVENAVFARATPEHKIRLVDALRAGGRIVAMTGDGVNDAPALKRSDIGVAMGAKGTEAAKEAGDMVLADDNFATIVHAVEEGRTVYDNLRKALIYVLPTSFGQAGVIVFAVLLGTLLPITPLQVLWVNLVTAISLSLSLAFDLAEPGTMRRPPRPRRAPLLTGLLIWRIGFVTALMVAGCAYVFTEAVAAGRPVAEARTLVVNALVAFEIGYLFNCRALTGTALRWSTLWGNRVTLYSIAAILLLQLPLTYWGPLQRVFDTAPLGLADWGRLALLGLLLFLAVEAEGRLRRLFRG